MRILRYLLWIPFVIIFISLLLGLFLPKVNIESTYTIKAPIADTWNYFHNQKTMHLWMDGFKSLQTVQETPNKIGSIYVLHFHVDDYDMEMNQTITEFDAYKKFGFKVDHSGATSNNNIEFIKNDNNTIIKQKIEMRSNTFFFRPILLIVKIAMKKENEKNYNKLKKLVESQYQS